MRAYATSRHTVRRFLLKKLGLLSSNDFVHQRQTPKPSSQDVTDLIQRLECVQIDPVHAVQRNHHLVLATRLPGYEPTLLEQALAEQHVFEYFANAACFIPIDDYPLFQPLRHRYHQYWRSKMKELAPTIEQIVSRLEQEGALPSRAFQSNKYVHGFWDNQHPTTKETSLALNILFDAGLITIARRNGSERYFDLTERVIPQKLLTEAKQIEETEARAALINKYIRAYRVFDIHDARFGWQKLGATERRSQVEQLVLQNEVIPLEIEGVKRQYYILSTDLEHLENEKTSEDQQLNEPIHFLPPLDQLLWRRDRIRDLFDFEYKWEIYIPKHKRQYGSYTMPILAGDRLIGRIDPKLDRENKTLHLQLLQLEPGVDLTADLRQKLTDALYHFATTHGATKLVLNQTVPEDLTFIL